MTDDGEHGGARDLLNRLTTKRPPWQVMVTGKTETPISPETIAALGRILDLMPGVGHLTLQTAGGGVLNVTRDSTAVIWMKWTGRLPRSSPPIHRSPA